MIWAFWHGVLFCWCHGLGECWRNYLFCCLHLWVESPCSGTPPHLWAILLPAFKTTAHPYSPPSVQLTIVTDGHHSLSLKRCFSQKATDAMFISVDFQPTAALNPEQYSPSSCCWFNRGCSVSRICSLFYSPGCSPVVVTAPYGLPALESGCSFGPFDLSPFVSCKTEMTQLWFSSSGLQGFVIKSPLFFAVFGDSQLHFPMPFPLALNLSLLNELTFLMFNMFVLSSSHSLSFMS